MTIGTVVGVRNDVVGGLCLSVDVDPIHTLCATGDSQYRVRLAWIPSVRKCCPTVLAAN